MTSPVQVYCVFIARFVAAPALVQAPVDHDLADPIRLLLLLVLSPGASELV